MSFATCLSGHVGRMVTRAGSLAHAVGMRREERSRRLDLWLAVAAGPGPWLHSEAGEPVDRLVLAGGIASAVTLGLAILSTAAASLEFQRWTDLGLVAGVLMTLIAVLFG